MPPKPPEKHFALVWYLMSAFLVVLALPLEYVGVEGWTVFTEWFAVFTFGWFLSAEWAAGGVERGKHGTYTSFLFWKIHSDEDGKWADVIRVTTGLVISAIVVWRFPGVWYLNRILGGFFFLWLPYHYSAYGIKGPVDHAAIWIGDRTGLTKLILKLRG